MRLTPVCLFYHEVLLFLDSLETNSLLCWYRKLVAELRAEMEGGLKVEIIVIMVNIFSWSCVLSTVLDTIAG